MPKLNYSDTVYECRDSETVLETLQRCGVDASFSCRSGFCQTCMLRSVSGEVPEKAQRGLRDSLRERGYFLACKCVPQEDMEITTPIKSDLLGLDLFGPAIVYAKELLSPNVMRLLLEPATSLYYHAGQYINLRRADGLCRNYSLVSVPSNDYFLELHIKRIPDGVMSNWIFDELNANDELEIQGPQGLCYYYPDQPTQNLLLIATGTGLAPLLGIINDALHNNHTGGIHLYHGSRSVEGLYSQDTLQEIADKHSNFSYSRCLSGNNSSSEIRSGRADAIAFSEHPELKGWRVYLCGQPAMVYGAQKTAQSMGVSENNIYIDPYLFSHDNSQGTVSENTNNDSNDEIDGMEHTEESRFYPNPDPEMWTALDEGRLLSEILKDFYTQVYDDPRLKSFFAGINKLHATGKQYNFLTQVFTGKKVYFGDRPRNAHHWMVISDELFDYREELMAACLRKHGLAEHLVKRWRAVSEIYRNRIVKSRPWGKIVNGISYPVEGYDELTLTHGTICDNCQSLVSQGEVVRYHVRLGTIHCKKCTEIN